MSREILGSLFDPTLGKAVFLLTISVHWLENPELKQAKSPQSTLLTLVHFLFANVSSARARRGCKTKSEPPFVTFALSLLQIDNCGERLTGHCSRNYLRKSAASLCCRDTNQN